MKHIIILAIASLFLSSAYTQNGTVHESLKFNSKTLGEEMEFAVYLPPDYYTSERFYPVVYLLHGYTDDETGWIQFGEANRIADAGIASGEISPMIIIMPDGGVSWYVNDYKGEHRWSDMFVEEFIPAMEDQYRIREGKTFRGISGLSMGGYGSLIHVLNYPEMFSGCVAFSSGIWTDEQVKGFPLETYNNYYGELYGPMEEGDELPAHWYKNSVLALAEEVDPEVMNDVRLYIDCGDDDFLAIGNASLHIIFQKREINHEYRVREGAHNWTYWRTGLTDGLKFLSDGFRQF